MKLNLIIFFCFTCFIPVARSALREVHHKYYLIMNIYTWSQAQNYCRVMYNDLATIITDDDWIQLNQEAASKGFAGYTWIGLYDDVTSWRWSLDGLLLKNLTYINWSYGSPNNYAGIESCGVTSGNGYWGDYPCTYLLPFVCYNANFTGSAKFIAVSNPRLNWAQAQAYCRTYHTDMASALNSTDNYFIAQTVYVLGLSWFGLYRDTWKWSDGTAITKLRWAAGEPNNYYGIEYCAAHIYNIFGDYPCSNTGYFFCHTLVPVREKQIVKLQVKSDGSVLDPAVQSYILEQIKKKMEEKGMLNNSTVTWRVQHDGNIFQKKL